MSEQNGYLSTFETWFVGWSEADRMAFAQQWAIPTTDPDALLAAVQQPEVFGRVFGQLSAQERSGIERLQEYQGRLPLTRMEREFGPLRVNLSYHSPRTYVLANHRIASITERLFALGLIDVLPDGAAWICQLPPVVAGMLPPVARQAGVLQLHPTAAPPEIVTVEGQIDRDLLTLLTVAQAGYLATGTGSALNRGALMRLARSLGREGDPPRRESQWPYVRFLRELALGAGLLRLVSDGLLRPTRVAIDWLRSDPSTRAASLLSGYVDGEWDELLQLAGMSMRRAFTRDLVAAKQALLSLFKQLPPQAWISLDDLVSEIQRSAPDFARPNGDYISWGIRGAQGEWLDGFSFWPEVEGQQIRLVMTQSLLWLGLLDVGMRDGRAESIRLTARGAALLHGVAFPSVAESAPLRVLPTFEVLVPPEASLYAQFQLGRMAEISSQQELTIYRLTRRATQAALEQGATLDDLLDFLTTQSGQELPQNVLMTMREWAGQYGQVTLRRVTLLETRDPLLLEQLLHDRRIHIPPADRLNDVTLQIAPGDASDLAERMRRAGYGVDGDGTERAPLREHDLTVAFTALEFYARVCAELGIEGDASVALRRRVGRLLSEHQRMHAHQVSRAALQALREREQ